MRKDCGKDIFLMGKAWLLSLLYPRAANCLCCGDPRRAEEADCLCPACRAALDDQRIPPESCEWCLSPLEKGRGCKMCKSPVMKYVDQVFAPWRYGGAVRQLIHAFKFYACDEALPILAENMERALKDRNFDCIVPVPLHGKRLRQRGVNQALLLARALSEKTGIPVRELLSRLHYHAPQSTLSPQQRQKNVDGAFEAKAECRGLKILLLDDVRTSGHTAHACAKAMKKAGAESICLCTAAVVYRKKK